MKISFEQMEDWEVAIDWLTNHLSKDYPDCTFEITHSSFPILGTTIVCKQVSGQPISKGVVQSIIDDCCDTATSWDDPEYGIFNRRTSRVKGKFISL